MTLAEFTERQAEPCQACGSPVKTEHNHNNNATQIVCSSTTCARPRTPWGLVHNIKTSGKKTRKPLPYGDSIDSVWEEYENVCFACGGPKDALAKLGIGRQVHHVLPHAQHGHQGPLVPICTLCHPVITERQRLYWFLHRLVLRNGDPS